MALNLLNGQMLNSTLERDGVNLSIVNAANSIPLLYLDIANNRVGVNTTSANIANATAAFTITGNATANNFNLTGDISLAGNVYAANTSISGTVLTVNLSATGNANAVNISASGNINAFANVIGGNINTSNNITAGNTIATANLSVTGTANINNLFATNFSTTGNTTGINLSLSGNITASNVIVLTDVTAVGNITGNVLSAVSNISAPNIYASTVAVLPNITGLANGNVTINHNGTGVINLDNIAITNTTVSSTVTTPVIIGGATGLGLPYGNNAQRPVVPPPTGTTRFNTILNNLETWDGGNWAPAGLMAGAPGAITDQQFSGTGNTLTFPLTQPVSASEIIVSVNGVLQIPNVAYSISGNTGNSITFGNLLGTGDVVDVRYIAYTGTVSSLENLSGNASISVTSDSTVQMVTANTVAATINSSGLLSITSQGVRLPSYTVTGAASIATPQPGQVIYVSNGASGSPCLGVWDGSSWKQVNLGSSITT